MTLKYSGKAFRKVVWKTSAEIRSSLHGKAFRALGVPRYVVLDNLREGVIKPSLYEPTLNATYAALLPHYGSTAGVCRVAETNRKGSVEQAIRYRQDTALKGRRIPSPSASDHPTVPSSEMEQVDPAKCSLPRTASQRSEAIRALPRFGIM